MKTSSSAGKLTKTKTWKGELVAVRNTKNFFAKLVLVAKTLEVDMKEVLCYPLRPYPLPFATVDGNMVKTSKCKLMEAIETPVGDDRLAETVPDGSALIIDAMAVFQTMKPVKETFGSLSTKVLHQIVLIAGRFRIDFVGDRYPPVSIKAVERCKRADSGSQASQIINEDQPVPKQWKKFLSNGDNKENLMVFIQKHWATKSFQEFKNKKVFMTSWLSCYVFEASNNQVLTREVPELKSDHEEADTRMVLHAVHASSCHHDVIIQSPDTDVFIICMSVSRRLANTTIYFATGTQKKKRIINMDIVNNHWGLKVLESLIGLHAFTGIQLFEFYYFLRNDEC